MKGLAATVEATLKDVIENDNWDNYGGKIETLGVISAENPESNYVQIPYENTAWNDTFTQEDYKAILAGILDGTIVVSNDITEMPQTAITIKTHANIK